MYAPLTSAAFDDLGAYNFEVRAIGNPQALISSLGRAILSSSVTSRPPANL